jgi:hypothetical protein
MGCWGVCRWLACWDNQYSPSSRAASSCCCVFGAAIMGADLDDGCTRGRRVGERCVEGSFMERLLVSGLMDLLTVGKHYNRALDVCR